MSYPVRSFPFEKKVITIVLHSPAAANIGQETESKLKGI